MALEGMLAAERGGIQQIYSVPAPSGGWNTRDAISEMSPNDAIELDNAIPSVGSVISRGGSDEFCTGLGADVETLAEYHSGALRKFIAAAGDEIFEISTATASSLGSGYTNARWQTRQFNAYLLMVNGEDTPKKYDGSTLTDTVFTGSGLTPENLVGIHSHRNRLYLWEANSQDFWYGGVNSIAGALTKFQLSRVADKGGNLVTVQSISRDSGSGQDDLIAFFMSSGEVLVYQGGDPGDAADWSLLGKYKAGAPISIRGAVEYKGDVLVFTKADAQSLNQMMAEGGFNNQPTKLSGAVADASRKYFANYGWQAILYPRGNLILFNVPIVENTTYHQYVMNTITGAFCRFKGWNARCFGIYNDRLYFGGNGKVFIADSGLDDNGENIVVSGQQAFTSPSGAMNKRYTRVRLLTKADGNVNYNISVAYDYGNAGAVQVVSSPSTGTPWGSPWSSPWSPEEKGRINSFLVSGRASAISVKLNTSLKNQQMQWFRTDIAYKPHSRFL